MKIRLAIMAVALALVFGGIVFFNHMRDQGMAAYFANNRPPPTLVSVAAAKSVHRIRTLSGIGSLEAVHQVTLSPEVAGRVTQILFTAGARVHKGDPLVQLDDSVERGDLANYQAQARYAEKELARSRALVGKQFAAQSTVDQNQATLDEARAMIAKTQAQIDQKLVRAPFDGRLGIRQIHLGEYLSAGTAIATLTDLTQMYVNFTLPEQDRPSIAIGQVVHFAVDAFPDRTFDARLTAIEPQVTASTRTIQVQATAANPDEALLPGMYANVTVDLPGGANFIMVPTTAVDYSLYGDSVFIVRQAGKDAAGKPLWTAKRTYVKTGAQTSGGEIAILNGVAAGDQVVVSGQLKLPNEAAVVPTTRNSLVKPAILPNS